jgi:hypothetical protein
MAGQVGRWANVQAVVKSNLLVAACLLPDIPADTVLCVSYTADRNCTMGRQNIFKYIISIRASLLGNPHLLHTVCTSVLSSTVYEPLHIR